MIAYIFPGQGSQFVGMGKDLYDSSPAGKTFFEQANEILGFRISDVMFSGTADELKQTKITQPAIFIHSIITAKLAGTEFQPDTVAGHSLGEFSALVAAKALSFEDGLKLVYQRALAMQKACEKTEGTMAAILGLDNDIVENTCAKIDDIVVAANYNCPGQLVISGSNSGVESAMEVLKEKGARRTILLPVGGAFHSPLMLSAQEELETAIANTNIKTPICSVYQNVNATAQRDPEQIKANLISQLTAPVKWTQTMENMIAAGVNEFVEVGGNGKVLQGFVKKIDRKFPTRAI